MSDRQTPPPLPPNQPRKDPGQDLGMRMLMPVGRSGWAIAAGYCGLFAFIAIGAPFALIFGILAVRDIQKSKKTDHPKYGMGRAIFGVVIGAIVCALIIAGLVISLFDK